MNLYLTARFRVPPLSALPCIFAAEEAPTYNYAPAHPECHSDSLRLRRLRSKRREAPDHASVHARSRPRRHGQDRQSLSGFLPLFVRQLGSQEPHPGGPGSVGCVLEAGHRESPVLVGDPDRGRGCFAAAQAGGTEDRRFLPRLHGRDRHRKGRPYPFAPRSGCDRGSQVKKKSRRFLLASISTRRPMRYSDSARTRILPIPSR